MQVLKKLSVLLFAFPLILADCTTPQFRVTASRGRKVAIEVAVDRVLIECEKVSDENALYGFMVFLLDDKNTVLSAIHGVTLEKTVCLRKYHGVQKVLERAHKIQLVGIGELDGPAPPSSFEHTFPNHGTFKDNGGGLQLEYISNEKGDCFDNYDGLIEKCPAF
jgi:hypothetical protein